MVGVRVKDILILVPSHGAQGVEAVAVQAADMVGGIGAAVGDHEQAGGQRQVLVQELELFEDGASAVAVSVQALAENGQTALAVDHGGEADLNHELLAGIAVADVSGGQLCIPAESGQGRSRTWLRRRVGSREDQVGRVKMQPSKG